MRALASSSLRTAERRELVDVRDDKDSALQCLQGSSFRDRWLLRRFPAHLSEALKFEEMRVEALGFR